MQAIPEAEEPTLGIPVLGTVVMGVPHKRASCPTPRKKRARPIYAKSATGNHHNMAMAAKPADHQTQQQQSEGLTGSRQPRQRQSRDAPDKPKAKPKKKRKVVPYESPPKLPPISPGALNLQEGVKRRRLAKQLEEQAAAEAASMISQVKGNAELPCAQSQDQLAGHPGSEAAAAIAAAEEPVPAEDGRDAGNVSQKVTSSLEFVTTEAQVHAENASAAVPHSNQPTLEHWTQPSAEGTSHSQLQSNVGASGSQGCDHTASQDHGDDGAATAGKHGMRACSQRLEDLENQQQQTLSFDVGSMELFQQQDTCDAFGSFWRRTGGVGPVRDQSRAQHQQAAPMALGGELVELQWFVEQCLLHP